MSRLFNAGFVAAGAIALLASPVRADSPFGTNFGLSDPLVASGDNMVVTYYGWEGTTVFGHTLWAFTAEEFLTNQNCFDWATTAGCIENQEILGQDIMSKPYGRDGDENAINLDKQTSAAFMWTPGTEVIFALMVQQALDENNLDLGFGYNWFFSGDPMRNARAYQGANEGPYAHLAYFGTNGVPGNLGIGTIPGTEGKFLFGFEDVAYSGGSDWDFNNAIFAIDFDSISPPAEVVPEPATMTLLATGLAALAAAGRRKKAPPSV